MQAFILSTDMTKQWGRITIWVGSRRQISPLSSGPQTWITLVLEMEFDCAKLGNRIRHVCSRIYWFRAIPKVTTFLCRRQSLPTEINFWTIPAVGMPDRINAKLGFLNYDISTALEELDFTRAFGPGILAASFYGIVSGSMSFVNKVRKILQKP